MHNFSSPQFLKNVLRSPNGKSLGLVALFHFLTALSLSISPTSISQGIDNPILWKHWIGFIVWAITFFAVLIFTQIKSIHIDQILFSLIALLSGWGLLVIWRLSPNLGLKQSAWLLICGLILIIVISQSNLLSIFRYYKYIWLVLGILLTAATFIFGTNPNGDGPKLWFGLFGLYFQPSEPLKLLLILFLAAYFSDRQPFSIKLSSLLAPTTILFIISILLLVFQRDLGTASIFLFIYASMIYLATEEKRLIIISALSIFTAAIAAYYFLPIIQVRINSWINPWIDPSGTSYQIVQSLISIAAGGMTGRGLGLGNPNFVPIAYSDFIFSAIAEEFGFPGTIGLIITFILLTYRGFKIGLSASNRYQQLLAIGLSTYLASQTILIIGGNIRLLPLTGVTLPFMSYGGSSLLTSFISIGLLILVNQPKDQKPANVSINTSANHLLAFLSLGFLALALINGWWAIWRGPDLLTRTDNPRRTISDQFVQRGAILDRNGVPIYYSSGEPGNYQRIYQYPEISPILGYTEPYYGQAGAESSLDLILRGLENQSQWSIWWHHLLYGQSPPGLDATISIDISLEQQAANLLSQKSGAIVLLDAVTGEIIVMYSSPFYVPSKIEEDWDALNTSESAPLINRAAQSNYIPGPIISPFIFSAFGTAGDLPEELDNLSTSINNVLLSCTQSLPLPNTWSNVIKFGCPSPLEYLSAEISNEQLLELFTNLGFYETPSIRIPVTSPASQSSISRKSAAVIGEADIVVTPLQIALASATISNHGIRPQAQFLLSAEDYQGEQVDYLNTQEINVFTANRADRTANLLAHKYLPIWESSAFAVTDSGSINTWYTAGTLPNADHPYVITVLVEEENIVLAEKIGQLLLMQAINQSE